MRTGETFTLPKATEGHDLSNELTMRRTVEQHLQDLRSDVVENRDMDDKTGLTGYSPFPVPADGGLIWQT